MPIIKNRNPPMRKLTQPWKLCRSFGSRPVGSVVGPRWPEAGIAAQQIPPLPSRWTFRGKGDSYCRPADPPNLVSNNHRAAGARNIPRFQVNCCFNLQLRGRVFRFMPCIQTNTNLPRPKLLPRFSYAVIAWYHLSLVKFLFSLDVARST
jgi:hypothetical protein